MCVMPHAACTCVSGTRVACSRCASACSGRYSSVTMMARLIVKGYWEPLRRHYAGKWTCDAHVADTAVAGTRWTARPPAQNVSTGVRRTNVLHVRAGIGVGRELDSARISDDSHCEVPCRVDPQPGAEENMSPTGRRNKRVRKWEHDPKEIVSGHLRTAVLGQWQCMLGIARHVSGTSCLTSVKTTINKSARRCQPATRRPKRAPGGKKLLKMSKVSGSPVPTTNKTTMTRR